MFQEIWDYLSKHIAPKANETIRIRFGFSGAQTEIDLEQFRVWAKSSRKITRLIQTTIWPRGALNRLFDLLAVIKPAVQYNAHPGYKPGSRMTLPGVRDGVELDGVGRTVGETLQYLIEFVAENWHRSDVAKRDLPELKSENQNVAVENEGEADLSPEEIRTLGYMLTDLIPMWWAPLEQWGGIPDALKSQATEFFQKEIAPLLRQAEGRKTFSTLEALDMLDLPFWKHRWHTYEIWATITVLRGLKDFRPDPIIVEGRIPLDGTEPAVVAVLNAVEKAFVHVQSVTAVSVPRHRKIMPDFRVAMDDPATNAATVAIVEFKQRRRLDEEHIFDQMKAYVAGAERGGGVVMINYDDRPKLSKPLPPDCVLIGNVRPGQKAQVEHYQRAVCDAVTKGGLVAPPKRQLCVLLDVSGSMQHRYESPVAQQGLRKLLELEGVHVCRFNDGLLPGGDWSSESQLTTSGGTQLGAALRQMYDDPRLGIPDCLLVVTDGEHDHPVAELSKITEIKECLPDGLESALLWLKEAEARDAAIWALTYAAVVAVFRHNLDTFNQIPRGLLQPVILKAAEWAKREQNRTVSRWRERLEELIRKPFSIESCIEGFLRGVEELNAQTTREMAEGHLFPEPDADNRAGKGKELW